MAALAGPTAAMMAVLVVEGDEEQVGVERPKASQLCRLAGFADSGRSKEAGLMKQVITAMQYEILT